MADVLQLVDPAGDEEVKARLLEHLDELRELAEAGRLRGFVFAALADGPVQGPCRCWWDRVGVYTHEAAFLADLMRRKFTDAWLPDE